MRLSVDHHERLLISILALSVVRVQLHALLKGLHRLVEFFMQLMTCALARPRLYKVCVQLDRLVSIFQRLGWLHQLDVGERTVRVEELVRWVTLNALVEFFDCTWEVAGLEKLITFFLVLLRDLRVEVSQCITLLLLFLHLLHGFFNVVVVELEQCLTILGNRLLE